MFLPSLIIIHYRLCYPVGQGLAVVRNHQTLLVKGVLHIAKLHKHCYGSGIPQYIQITLADRSTEAPARLMLSVFAFESLLNFCCKTFAVFAFRSVVEIYVCLLASRTAVNVDKYSTLIAALILTVEIVYSHTPLLQSFYLIKRNRLAHTGLTLAVLKDVGVADTVFGILNDKIYLCSPL